jgi:phosphatidylglycerophosphatase A
MVVAQTDAGELMGRVYGHVLDRLDQTDLFLYEVDVGEEHQRKGAGRAMLEFLTELCRARGYGEWFVLTEVSNAAGNGLYRSADAITEGSPANVYVRSTRIRLPDAQPAAAATSEASTANFNVPQVQDAEPVPSAVEDRTQTPTNKRPRADVMNRIALPVSTLGGVGNLPGAPGTWASLVALPFAWLLLRYGGQPLLLECAALATAIGIWMTDIAAKQLKEPDPSQCVIDELAGQWLTCAFAPLSLVGFLLAFVLFRLFDIVKPWPASAAERLPGGLGIMADDIVAGLMGGAIIAAVYAAGLI